MTFTPTVNAESLAGRLKRPADDPRVEEAFNTAVALLTDATTDTYREIPENVANTLVLQVARAVWDQGKTASYGGSQTTQVTGETAVRAPRDPLAVVAPILARYTVVGLA